MDLTGVSLITGAASGIGRETAIAFAQDGCTKLALGDVNQTGLEETKKLILEFSRNAKITTNIVDVRKEESVNAFIKAAVDTFGRIDYACNIAGLLRTTGNTHSIPMADYDLQMDVNLRGVFLCERAELNIMMKQEPRGKYNERGVVINMASIAGMIAYPDLSVYAATKAAVLNLTKSDGLFYGKYGIRIVAVCPGNGFYSKSNARWHNYNSYFR
jgi:NAD(P)-dependent dehydrogenase (short-subunit alcohol dehydrogenase family)